MRRQILKVVRSTMHFHSSARATAMCVCTVKNGVGYDAFSDEYSVVTDDFGNQVFVKTEFIAV